MFPAAEHVIVGTLRQQTNHTRLGYISKCIGELAAVEAQSVRHVHACPHNLPRSCNQNDATANRSGRTTITNRQSVKTKPQLLILKSQSCFGRYLGSLEVCRPDGGQCFRAAGVFCEPSDVSRHRSCHARMPGPSCRGHVAQGGDAPCSLASVARNMTAVVRHRYAVAHNSCELHSRHGAVGLGSRLEVLRCWSPAASNVSAAAGS